ncbi:MAG: TonB-dependent receptor [Verrucomicrobiota bacterium]
MEVLKGRLASFRRGALAGAVNYVPKSTRSDHFEHELFTSYGSFNTSRLGLGSAGPIGQTGGGYRFDFSRQSSDGYVDDTASASYDIAGSLRYDVSDQLYLTFSFDALWQDFSGYWGTPLVKGRVDPLTRQVNYNIADDIDHQENQWFRLQAHWAQSEAVQVRQILYGFLADRHWQNVERYTYVAASNAVRRSSPVEIRHDQTLVGHRMDVTLSHDLFERENKLLGGLEGFLDHFQRDSNRPDSGFDFVDLYDPAPRNFSSLQTVATSPERRTRTATGALLLEDRFQLFRRFSLMGGVRGEVIDLHSENLRPNPTVEAFNRTFTPVTGRIGGDFEPIPRLDLYALYGTAAKAPNALVVLDETFQHYGLEQGEMVEVGVKQAIWEHHLEWTAALYQIWKSDIVTRDPVDSSRNLQIGKQSSQGLELGLSLQPVPEWTLGGNLVLLDAHYDTFNIASGTTVISYADNTPPNVPEVVANVWTNYRLPFGLELGALVRYVGETQANNANTIPLPDYSTLDLFAGYSYQRVQLGVRARNVLDRQYALWSSGDGAQVLLGAPLSIEGSIRVRF